MTIGEVIQAVYEASGYEYQPIPDEPAAGPRVITYWQRGPRWSSLRRVVVPEPVKTDSWGRPIR
jgi:hypothetical protein